MGFEDRGKMIEQKQRVAKMMGVIFGALSICDIEYDKICPALRPRLGELVEELEKQFPPDNGSTAPRETEKVSITRTSLDELQNLILASVTSNFGAIGMKGFVDSEVFRELGEVLRGSIEYEKAHRDAERQ